MNAAISLQQQKQQNIPINYFKSEREYNMRKVISLILAILIVFSFSSTVLAASQKCSCDMTPVVYIPGFGDPIFENPNTEDEVSLFPPEGDAIMSAVPEILMAVTTGLTLGTFDNFGTYAMKAAEKILGKAACNADGTAPENTGVNCYELPAIDTHKLPAFAVSGDNDEGYFRFGYDWRLDPIENAKLLKEYIDAVKELTGHKEIVLACHSQGNTVAASYLHLYGSKGIEKILFLSPAFQGLSLVGALFTKEVSVYEKGEELETYIKGIMGMESAQNQLIGAVISELNKSDIINIALAYIQGLLNSQLSRIFDECLVDLLGTMPGLWSFVPDEYYEDAKSTMFRGLDKYNELEKKADYYHYNVQVKITDIIKKAKRSGTDIVIAAGYDISTIPVTYTAARHGDYLIDTEYMTLGATCAPLNQTFGKNYRQAKRSCGHNHISADLMIDASTCVFPEYTWFVRGNGHNSFDDGYCEFIEWAIRYDGQPTVRSNKQYPQFMAVSGDALLPVEGAKPTDSRSDKKIIFDSLITILKESF